MPHIDVDIRTLPFDSPVRIENGAAGIVVVRTARSIVAYEDVCPHAGWRLSDGEVFNGRLECPGHGWEFVLDDGRCSDVPAYCLRGMNVTMLDESCARIEWQAMPVSSCVAEGV